MEAKKSKVSATKIPRGAGSSSRGAGSSSRGGRGTSRGRGSVQPYYPVPPVVQPYQMQYYQPHPGQYNFSLQDQHNFDPFAPRFENPPFKSPRTNEERPLPIFDDTFYDEDRVPETQYQNEVDDEELENIEISDEEYVVEEDDQDDEEGNEDDQDDEEGNDDDEELEDITPENVGKFKGRAERQEWTEDQKVCLAKAWIHISEDKKVGNQQTRDGFWNKILKHYNSLVGGSNRNVHQLRSRWISLNQSMTSFNGFYIQAERLRASGCDDGQVMLRAMKDYQKKHKGGFKDLEAWKVVKSHDKWLKVPLMGEEFSSQSDKKRKSSDSSNYQNSTNDDAQTTRRIPDLNEDTTPTRPYRRGRKSAESSKKVSVSENIALYASKKEEFMKAALESRIKKDEEATKLLAEQREAVREKRYDRDLKMFTEPHDHVTGPMLEILLERKRQIAKIHNWPCNF